MFLEKSLSQRLRYAFLKLAIAVALISAGRELCAGLSGGDLAEISLVEVGGWPHHPIEGTGFGYPGDAGWQPAGSTSQSHIMMAATGIGANHLMDPGGGYFSRFSRRKRGISSPVGGSGNNESSGSAGRSKGDGLALSNSPAHWFVTSSIHSGFSQWGGKSASDFVTNFDHYGSRKYKSTDTTDCNPPPSCYPPPSCNPYHHHGHHHHGHHHHHHHHHHHDGDGDGDDHHHHHIVPEPGSMTLWGVGVFSLLGWKSLRSRKSSG